MDVALLTLYAPHTIYKDASDNSKQKCTLKPTPLSFMAFMQSSNAGDLWQNSLATSNRECEKYDCLSTVKIGKPIGSNPQNWPTHQ